MFSILDVIFIIIIAIVSLVATAKGFLKEIFNKASWLLSIFFGIMFYSWLEIYIAPFVKFQIVAKILSFLLIFVLVFLVIKIVQAIFSKIFEGEILRGLDRALGFLLGIAEGLGIVFVIIFLMRAQIWFPLDEVLEESFFYNFFKNLLPATSDNSVAFLFTDCCQLKHKFMALGGDFLCSKI